jgi:cellobiose-specific phosphotransferase system component IIA
MDTSKLIDFGLQQGVAIVSLGAIAVTFALAVTKLFKASREDRDKSEAKLDAAAAKLDAAHAAHTEAVRKTQEECRDERKEDRQEFVAALDRNTAAIQRIADDRPLRVVKEG